MSKANSYKVDKPPADCLSKANYALEDSSKHNLFGLTFEEVFFMYIFFIGGTILKIIKRLVFLILIASITLLVFVYTSKGMARTDVILEDFSLSNDGNKLHIDVMVSGSMGYAKK